MPVLLAALFNNQGYIEGVIIYYIIIAKPINKALLCMFFVLKRPSLVSCKSVLSKCLAVELKVLF